MTLSGSSGGILTRVILASKDPSYLLILIHWSDAYYELLTELFSQ